MQGLASVAEAKLGTRPGDTVADLVFNLFMIKPLSDIREAFNSMGIRTQYSWNGCRTFTGSGPTTEVDVSVDQVVWVDDMAFLLENAVCSSLVVDVVAASRVIFDVFRSYGMKLNMKKDKTNAMITFRGEHMFQAKRKLEIENGNKLFFL